MATKTSIQTPIETGDEGTRSSPSQPISQVAPTSNSAQRSGGLAPHEPGSDPGILQSIALQRALILIGLISILLLISFWIFGYGKTRTTDIGLTQTITRGDLIVSVTEQGTLESSNNTEIKCKIRGTSTVTWVIEGGTIVEKGDDLVRLDTKRIEDAIGKHSTDAYVAKATFERTKADVARAEIAIEAYLEGTYKTELKALEKQLARAKANLDAAQKVLAHTQSMFRRGYVNKYEAQSSRIAVKQAELEYKIRQKEIDVLNNYTKEMELETLRGDLRSLKSKFEADKAGLAMDEGRRDRAIEELDHCVIKAERGGLLIYPSAAAWKETPDITEGASVRNDQVLLLMPDLSKMQIKVGIHEALIDKVKPGQVAKVTTPDLSFEGQVEMVASIAKPAGWWTGNMVKYDTIIKLPETEGLKPGMSAEVEIILSEHADETLVPVSAIVETGNEKLCWIKTPDGVERRVLELGESDEVFVIAKSGLAVGDEVVLNPLRYVEDAKGEALRLYIDPDESTLKVDAGDSADPNGEELIGQTTGEAANGN